jgi:hypothetical protein
MKTATITSLLLLYVLAAQSQKIKGNIHSADGKPLGYASVYVKGTNKGTHANNEGKYSIKLENGQHVLVCQHVGYQKEEITVSINNDDKEINFILVQQEVTLAEAVVKTGEDPAYAIIRNAIKKRTHYRDNWHSSAGFIPRHG